MVTAEVEEVRTETEAEPVTPPLDTPATESPPAETSDTDALKAFEQEIGIEAETEGGSKEDVTGAVQNPPAEDAEERAAKERIRAEVRAEEERARQDNGRRTAYANRISSVERVMGEVAAGRRDLFTPYSDLNGMNVQQWVKAVFNAHHSDTQDFSKEAASAYERGVIITAAKKALPGLANNYATADDLMSASIEEARKGYVSKREHDQAVKAAGVAAYNKLKSNPAAVRALLSQLEGSTGAGGGASIPSGQLDPFQAPMSEVNKRLAAMGL